MNRCFAKTREMWDRYASGKPFWVLLFLVTVFTIFFMNLLPSSTWYEPIGWIDAYMYVGYGHTYPDDIIYPGYYKISRLPWIWFLSLYYRLINSDYAIPILAISRVLAQGVLAYVVSWRFTRNLASSSLTSIFVTTSSLWYHVGGWDYHAVPGGIVLWTAMAFLPLKGTDIPSRRYLPSFVFFTIGVHTNPMNIAAIPAFIVLCLTPMFDAATTEIPEENRRVYRKKFFWRIILHAVVIFASVTVIIAIIHKILYGSILFYKPGLRILMSFVRRPSKDLWTQAMGWDWLTRPYIVFLIAMSLCAAFILIEKIRIRKDASISSILVSCAFLITIFLFFIGHLHGVAVLSWDFHAFPAQCYGMLIIAAFINVVFPDWRSSLAPAAALSLGGGLFFAATGVVWDSLSPSYPITLTVILIAFLFGICLNARYYVMKAILVVLLLCTMLFPMRSGASIDGPLNKAMLGHYKFILNLNESEASRGRENKSLNHLFATAYVGGDEFFNDDSKRLAKDLMMSFESLGFNFLGKNWGDCILSPDKTYEVNYYDGMRVVVLGSSRDLTVKIEDGLGRLGLDPELQHARLEIRDGVDVYMWIYKVNKAVGA